MKKYSKAVDKLNKKYAKLKQFRDTTASDDLNYYAYSYFDVRSNQLERLSAFDGIQIVTKGKAYAYLIEREKINRKYL
jgi:hypothetical protein